MRVHTVEQKIEEKVDDTAGANVAAKHVNESLRVVAEKCEILERGLKKQKRRG